jgi:hypothetical protein
MDRQVVSLTTTKLEQGLMTLGAVFLSIFFVTMRVQGIANAQ